MSITFKLLIVSAILVSCLADKCGGNCLSAECPECTCGNTPNYVTIEHICSKLSWNQSCCKCVLSRENGGNANAIKYTPKRNYDLGLFMINHFFWLTHQCEGHPCEPEANAKCAFEAYKDKKSFSWMQSAAGCGCT